MINFFKSVVKTKQIVNPKKVVNGIFKDKVALVTGGGGGIGFEICKTFLNQGCRAITIADKDVARGEKALKKIAQKFGNGKAIFVECDVTKSELLNCAFKNTIKIFDRLDIVVNNAGVLNDKSWENEVATNINGYLIGSLLALQYMSISCKGRGGYLVNIISTTAIDPRCGCPIYTMTQSGILGLTRALAEGRQCERTGVKVVALCAGLTDTKMLENATVNMINRNFSNELEDELAKDWVQEPSIVAEALTCVLKNEENGIWVIDKGRVPFRICVPSFENMKYDLNEYSKEDKCDEEEMSFKEDKCNKKEMSCKEVKCDKKEMSCKEDKCDKKEVSCKEDKCDKKEVSCKEDKCNKKEMSCKEVKCDKKEMSCKVDKCDKKEMSCKEDKCDKKEMSSKEDMGCKDDLCCKEDIFCKAEMCCKEEMVEK